MSQPDSRAVSNRELGVLQLEAERIGHLEAIRQYFKLPRFNSDGISEKVHCYFISEPSSFFDAYLLERAWLKAVEQALFREGYQVHFTFEIDLLVVHLPKSDDNPT